MPLDYPPNHVLIISITEIKPSIPASVAVPFLTLISLDGCLLASSNKQIILSKRSNIYFSPIIDHPIYCMEICFALIFQENFDDY